MTRNSTRTSRHFVLLIVGALAVLIAPSAVHAVCVSIPGNAAPRPTIPASISSARDAQIPGTLVEAGSLSNITAPGGLTEDCNPNKWDAKLFGTSALVPNVTYLFEGQSVPVYETGIPGIGFAAMVRLKHPSVVGPWHALTSETLSEPTPANGNGNKQVGPEFRLALVFSGSLVTGSYKNPQKTIGQSGIYSSTQNTTHTLYLPALSVNVTTDGCSLTSGTHNTIPLPGIYGGALKAVGDVSDASKNLSVSVACRGKVSVHVTMTDINQPANTGNTLSLSPTSGASGVGVQLFRQGNATPIRFGPDSAAKGNTNQWFVDEVNDGGTVTIPLVAKYVKTAPTITPGTVDARASFTFSYQ